MYDEYFYHAVPSELDGFDIPLGLGNAFANDISGLLKFAGLSRSEQMKFLKSASNVQDENSVKMHEKNGSNSL